MDILDKNILKVLITDNAKALEFVYSYDQNLFEPEVRQDAKMVIDFIKSYRSVPTKRTLVSRYADTPEKLNEISSFWNSIKDHQYNGDEFLFDLENLKERFKKDSVKKISTALAGKMSEGEEPDLILRELALKLQQANIINNGRSHIQKSAGDYVDEFKDRYDSKKNTEIETPDIMTGYTMLDSVTGGLSPAELIIIGGETNAGKSMLLNSMSIQMWLQGNTVSTPKAEFKKGTNILYFSLEMPYADCYDRFLARVADIPQRSLKDAVLDSEETERMNKALIFIKEYQDAGNYFNIVDVPRNVTIEEVELRFQDALLQFRPDAVVIDYMGLMHDPAKANEPDWLKMGAIAASLHEFSRAYNVVMLTAVQLTDQKRGSKSSGEQDENQRVGIHRIGRSSHIMHHVNIGIQIETRLNERNLPDMKYHVIKNRKGPLGKGNMIKNFEHAALFDVPYSEDSGSGNDISNNMPELIKKIRENNGDE